MAAKPSGMDAFARDKGFCGWFNVSARENYNVDKASGFLINKILDNEKWKEQNMARSLDLRYIT